MMKSMKIATLAKLGREAIRVWTYLLMEGTALILLRGLSTLRVLKAFKLTSPPINSITPVSTTKKSITFQPSLR